jgi:ankyrin repeat protein
MTNRSGDPGRNALNQAVVEGDASAVARLISDGVDLASADNMGNTALHLACQQESR